MELGANHVGEIAYTTHLVKPDVACVLNIGTAHLGEFGGRDNITCQSRNLSRFAGTVAWRLCHLAMIMQIPYGKKPASLPQYFDVW